MERFIVSKRPYKYSASYYRKVKCYIKEGKYRRPITILQSSSQLSSTLAQLPPPTEEPLISRLLPLPQCTEPIIGCDHEEENYNTTLLNEFHDEDGEQNDLLAEKLPAVNGLKDWALRNQIKHTALNELLKLLSTSYGIEYLPKDSRTLLRTPKLVNIQQMGTDEFWYNGIQECLFNMFSNLEKSTQILLNFHIDGLPISGSSKHQFWPILMNVANMPHVLSPMVVAIYSGTSKPSSAEEFLRQFVNELNEILQNGLMINRNRIDVKVNAFICDTPARCFLKC